MPIVKEIRIVFRNGDSIQVDKKYLDILNLGQTDIVFDSYKNEVVPKVKKAENLAVSINRKFNIKHNHQPFKRILNSADIVDIEIHYFDGDIEELYPDWYSDTHNQNRYQNSKIARNGNLLVYISKSGKYSDFFMNQ